jgi:hypothetical protein
VSINLKVSGFIPTESNSLSMTVFFSHDEKSKEVISVNKIYVFKFLFSFGLFSEWFFIITANGFGLGEGGDFHHKC